MSFQPIAVGDLSVDLILLKAEQSNKSVVNVVRRMTIGLKQFHTELQASARMGSFGVASWPTSHTDSSGAITNLLSLPMLGKRYSTQHCLGTGRFSQTVAAIDSLSQRSVCIKIMNAKYSLLGAREALLLQRISQISPRSTKFVLDYVDHFFFDGHYCLVLPIMGGTLFDFLSVSSRGRDDESLSGSNGLQHPRVVRPTGSRMPHGEGITMKPMTLQSTNIRNSLQDHEHGHSVVGQTNFINSPIIRFEEKTIKLLRHISLSLINALLQLHDLDIIHADIKPENCFLTITSTSSGSQVAGIDPNSGVNHVDTFFKRELSPMPATTNNFSTSWKLKSEEFHANFHVPSMLTKTVGSTCNSVLESKKYSIVDLNFDKDLEPLSIQVGDLGNAIHLSEANGYHSDYEIQTLQYRAPEALLGVPFDTQVDVWSVGVVLVELCLGRPLFEATTRSQQIINICEKLVQIDREDAFFHNAKYLSLLPAKSASSYSSLDDSFSTTLRRINALLSTNIVGIPPEFKHFCASLLQANPRQRLTPVEALKHPFLARYSLAPLYRIQEHNQAEYAMEIARNRIQIGESGLAFLRQSVRRPAIIPKLPQKKASSFIESPPVSNFGRVLASKRPNLSDLDDNRATHVNNIDKDGDDDDDVIYSGGKKKLLKIESSSSPIASNKRIKSETTLSNRIENGDKPVTSKLSSLSSSSSSSSSSSLASVANSHRHTNDVGSAMTNNRTPVAAKRSQAPVSGLGLIGLAQAFHANAGDTRRK